MIMIGISLMICLFFNEFLHTLTVVKQAALFPLVFTYTSHTLVKTVTLQLHAPPAQRRSMTSALYLQTTARRHSPWKPFESFDRTRPRTMGILGMVTHDQCRPPLVGSGLREGVWSDEMR